MQDLVPSLLTLELYLVPKHWAEAVGSRTKFPQKEKKMAQIHTAYSAY